MIRAKALASLKDLHKWSLNGIPHIWQDFVNIANTETWGEDMQVDFSRYGFKEFVLFGKCLLIFENYGYVDVYKMIQEVENEYEKELVCNG